MIAITTSSSIKGKLLRLHLRNTSSYQNVYGRRCSEGHVFVAGGRSVGVRVVRTADDKRAVEELWWDDKPDNRHGGAKASTSRPNR